MSDTIETAEITMLDHLKAIIAIQDVILGLAMNSDDVFCHARQDAPNSVYDHTKQGLILEMYYGTPSRLYTPWGGLDLIGCCASNGGGRGWDGVLQDMKAKVGLELFKEEIIDTMGHHGPWYAITSVEHHRPKVDLQLPAPIRTGRGFLLPGDPELHAENTSRLDWALVTLRYELDGGFVPWRKSWSDMPEAMRQLLAEDQPSGEE